MAEGDVGTLNVNGFFLAIYFDGHSEKKLQQAIIPDIVLVQHKPFHTWRASEDKVFSVMSMVHPVGKGSALQTLMSIVYSMSDLQCPETADVSLTQQCQHHSANLTNGIVIITHYNVLLHISTHHYYREPSQQAPDVQRPQHGVYVQTTMIRRQGR